MKTAFNKGRRVALAAAAMLLAASSSWAQWELDNSRSELNFVSIKNASVAETHRFGSLVGFITEAGKVQVNINLDSVDTQIDIRNERMREYLFQTVDFPTAAVTASVDPEVLNSAARGGTLTTDVAVQLSLHGLQQTLSVPVVVVGAADGGLRVVTARPVTVRASDFALDGGIARLQELAGLASISTAVPVTLNLVFVRAD